MPIAVSAGVCKLLYITGINYEICNSQGTWNLTQSVVTITCWHEQAFWGHEDGPDAVSMPPSRTQLGHSHSPCTEQKQNHSLQQVARQFPALGTPSTDLQLSQPVLAHKTLLRTRPSHTAKDLAKQVVQLLLRHHSNCARAEQQERKKSYPFISWERVLYLFHIRSVSGLNPK